jgi:HlyD family secretion protein
MKQRRILIGAAVLALVVGAALYLRSSTAPAQYQGWVEADMVFVSPDEIGRIENLEVREGSHVEKGSPLFTLDEDLQQAAVAENEAYVANAKIDYNRAEALLKKNVGSEKAFDDAKAQLRSAEAKLNSAKTKLERRKRFSPVAGTIQEVYFRGGEMVDPSRPILSIMPPGNVKVRFFVPQAQLPKVHMDERVLVTCDGCAKNLPARVSFISAKAEFTPPVIYSLEERARLVFRIEALPERPEELRIGQPASVALDETQPSTTQPPRVSDAKR